MVEGMPGKTRRDRYPKMRNLIIDGQYEKQLKDSEKYQETVIKAVQSGY